MPVVRSPSASASIHDDDFPTPHPNEPDEHGHGHGFEVDPALVLRRDYLALLDKPKLVDLLLALDADRSLVIFPPDLPTAVRQLRETHTVGVVEGGAGPLFTSTPLPMPMMRQAKVQLEQSEMPSYEEMIAQAIAELADPDGTAPKVLFQWMDQHYPLQNNFRPSASQALQRAYKRGRLDKLPSGRYILNPNWDGAPTSKRATRRPKQVKLEPGLPMPMPIMPFRSPNTFTAPPPQAQPHANGYSFPLVVPTPIPPAAKTTTTITTRNGRARSAVAEEDDGMDVDDAPTPTASTPAPIPAPIPAPTLAPAPIPVPALYLPMAMVKAEPTEPTMGMAGMELDPELAESVHGLFATLARQLTELQAERRKGRPK